MEEQKKKKRTPIHKGGGGKDRTDYIPDFSLMDWGEEEPKENDKYFIYYYTTLDQPLWHNKTQCAIKCGSKSTNPYITGRQQYIRCKKWIDRIENQMIDTAVTETKVNFIDSIISRSSFDIKDFYVDDEFEDKEGNLRQTIRLKTLDELTPEQRKCIDGIEFDNYGRPNFKLADREKAYSRLSKIMEVLKPKEENGDGYDVKVTVEGIKEKLEVKAKIIKENEELAREAEGIDEETENEEL